MPVPWTNPFLEKGRRKKKRHSLVKLAIFWKTFKGSQHEQFETFFFFSFSFFHDLHPIWSVARQQQKEWETGRKEEKKKANPLQIE